MGDCNKDKDEGEMMLREMKTRTRDGKEDAYGRQNWGQQGQRGI